MRLSIFICAFTLPLFLSPFLLPSQELPNIILILVDDMGWSDIGCYGSEIETPNIDRLANNGIRFTQFYNTAKCFPSRACLLTGVYAQQCGYGKTHKAKITNAVTLGEVLKNKGYRTLWSGKHHGIENPIYRGFDRYFGLRDGACNHFNPGEQRQGEGKPAQKRPNRHWCIDDKEFEPYTPEDKDFYSTDYFTKYALNWLEEYKKEEKPFFLYLAYTAPHDPLMAWPEDIKKYQNAYNVGYEEIRKKRYAKQLSNGLIDESTKLSKPSYKPWEDLSEEKKAEEALKMAVYAAMVDRVDQNIGKILTSLESSNKLDNTLFLFMSDNGSSSEMVRLQGSGDIGTLTRWTSLGGDWANVGNTPFRLFKNYSHEGGIRTPLVAHWPKGIKDPGRISEFCGHFIDIMSTLVDLSGADYPEEFNGQNIVPMQGTSFLPVLKGERLEREKPIFWQWSRGKAMRQGKWKLVKWEKHSDLWSLYDMEKDPVEEVDLAEEYPKKVKEMETLFNNWLANAYPTEEGATAK